MKSLLIPLAALMLMGAADAPSVDDLAWMAGTWAREADDRWSEESWTEESWTGPRGGVMLGVSRSGAGAALREFEFLRVQADGDGVPTYIAQPGGRAPVAFRLVRHDATGATFENAAHDYPQRIQYVRDGDTMTATISASDGSKAMQWQFTRR